MMIAMMPTKASTTPSSGIMPNNTTSVPNQEETLKNAKAKVTVSPCNSNDELLRSRERKTFSVIAIQSHPPPTSCQTPSQVLDATDVQVEVLPTSLVPQLHSSSSSPDHPNSLGRTTKQLKCKLVEILMNLRLYFLLVFFVFLGLASIFVRSATYSRICLTRDCVLESAKILNSIEPSVSPCEDFYRFSCGRWLENTIMPEHMPAQNVFSQVQERQDRRLRELMEAPIDKLDPDFVVKMKNLYKNCMNLTALDALDDQPLQQMIDSIGGWPVLEGAGAPEPNVSLLSLYRTLVHLGLADDMLVLITVIPHATNFSRNMLAISAPSFDLLDREFMTNNLDDMHLQTYYSLMLNTVGLLMQARQHSHSSNQTHTDRSYSSQSQSSQLFSPPFSFRIDEVEKMLDPFVVNEMKLVLEFEQSLANHSIKDTDKTNISSIYNNMTVMELQKLAPSVPWIELINAFPVENNISLKDEILVVDINYIRFLSEAIQNVPKRVLMNYIVWRVVQTKIGVLNQVWRDLIENFNLINLGQSKPTPRWMHCVSHVQGQMGTALSNLYVKHYFTAEGKDKIDKIVHKILAEFHYTLERTEWMDAETKRKAIHKLNTMNFRIGFPNELLNDTLVSELYNKLTISENDYFSNLIEIKKYMNYIKFANITIPNDREDWRSFSEVVEVNAYYFQQMNTFILNAGILQDIFFNPNRPDYMNYGAIGEVIGHEITHGFDSTGKQFDVDGHLHDWWNPETGKMFDQKASCMEKQYSRFHFDEIDLKVNGIRSKDENIADNGGVGLAYRAYRRAYNFRESILPALNYTAQQLFWISYGIGECEKMTNEVLKLRIVTDTHAPNKYRLIGVVSNSYDFARDFNCPKDSPMNPKTKCKVW